MERVFSGLVLAMTSLFCQAQPVPDFQLRDENFNSPRGGQIVSPRDYKMQITAVYFGEAGCGGCRTQFAELQKMQNTVNALNTDLKIEIDKNGDDDDTARVILPPGVAGKVEIRKIDLRD